MECNDKLLKLPDVLARVPVSDATWRKWVRQGNAPAKIKLGRSVFWLERDVQAFINGTWQPDPAGNQQ
jgi:prophage regulatory protein